MQGEKIFSALTGLVGAMSGHGKSENTDRVILEALRSIGTLRETGSSLEEEAVEMIHREKYTIAPDCATCASPCGNTSDYDLSYIADRDREMQEEVAGLIDAMFRLAVKAQEDEELCDDIITGIAYLGYDLDAASYRRIRLKLAERE